jgi:hypothetical protein
MTHAEQQSEERDPEWRGIGRIHWKWFPRRLSRSQIIAVQVIILRKVARRTPAFQQTKIK